MFKWKFAPRPLATSARVVSLALLLESRGSDESACRGLKGTQSAWLYKIRSQRYFPANGKSAVEQTIPLKSNSIRRFSHQSTSLECGLKLFSTSIEWSSGSCKNRRWAVFLEDIFREYYKWVKWKCLKSCYEWI